MRCVWFLCLIDVLSPVEILNMAPDFVNSIAGESTDRQNQRDILIRQLAILNKGVMTSRKYVSIDREGKSDRKETANTIAK